MQIRLINRFAELEEYAPRWNSLLARSGSDSIFLTWQWLASWWDVFGGELTLMVLVAEEHGELLGLAPLMIAPFPGPGGRHVRTLMFMGQGGDTLAEFLDLIVLPERRAEVVHAFADELRGPLRKRWDALLLQRVVTESPNLELFERRLAARGVTPRRRNEFPAPYLALPSTLDALLSAKSGNFRYQYQRSRKRLAAAGTAQLLLAGRDLRVDEALTVLAELNRERWQQAGTSFRTDRYRRFHGTLATALQEQGWLWLGILELNGEPVAARYDFVYGGKVWCMQGGWKPTHESLNLGTIMTGEVMGWAIDRGFREYDFLGGEDHYKRRWADRERLLVDLEAFNPATWRGWLWPRLRALKKAVATPSGRRRGAPPPRPEVDQVLRSDAC